MSYRVQKNLTITAEQVDYIKANYGKMNISTLAKMLGLKYNKVYKNLVVMEKHKSKSYNGIVVDMKDFFDVDKFGKYYNY